MVFNFCYVFIYITSVLHEPKEAYFLAERQVRLHLGRFI
nr:MAG TPA: hypothetical protein [Caudoviricetes sp.]